MSFASARLRLLASVFDAVIILGGMASVIGLGVAGAVAYKRVRGGGRPQGVCEEGDGWDGGEQDDRPGTRGSAPRASSGLTRPASELISPLLATPLSGFVNRSRCGLRSGVLAPVLL